METDVERCKRYERKIKEARNSLHELDTHEHATPKFFCKVADEMQSVIQTIKMRAYIFNYETCNCMNTLSTDHIIKEWEKKIKDAQEVIDK
jgi:hypothetical protein